MTPNGLGLDTASQAQGFDVIPAGTQVELVMNIKPGNIGIENLLKRTSKGDAEMLDVEFTIKGGEFDKRKIFANMLLDGTTSGHAKAGEISRSLLRAIFEAINAIDPKDSSPATTARRASATLAGFNGATFLATLEIEKGGKRSEGGFYKDKNIIGKVLRVGDPGYRKLEQPPPAPIERSTPPLHSATPGSPPPPNGSPAVAPAAIAKPSWAN
jgi:hypothetical protein